MRVRLTAALKNEKRKTHLGLVLRKCDAVIIWNDFSETIKRNNRQMLSYPNIKNFQ
jgi:uncharacterized protein YheU (UPF0270 family)